MNRRSRTTVTRACAIVCLLICVSLLGACNNPQPVQATIAWERLPDLPLATAGTFAGVTNGALIVAGGAYFPGTPSYEGGAKVWVDSVYVLPPGADTWKRATSLDEPRAYGASVTAPDGILFIGGSDADGHTRDVSLVRWTGDRLEREQLPPLPEPLAMTNAVLLNRTVFVAGGQESPGAGSALRNFWALDLDSDDSGWKELEPWPGPARILPAMAVQDGAVYLFSGAELIEGEDGTTTRRFLKDGYRYIPDSGWKTIAVLPRPAVAAPAAAIGASHVAIFGGDTGEDFFHQRELRDRHPGFSTDVLGYHTITNTWAVLDSIPRGLVTTNAVRYQGGIVIPGGEDRPGHRSTSVFLAMPSATEAQFGIVDYSVLLLYLAILVAMGFYFSRREQTTDDFFLAGRRIPWWAAGLSIFGTQLSAITFMAIPAKAFATDWVFFLANMTIVLVAPLVVFFYLPFFRRLNITTAYEYLEKRFNLAVRWFGSLAFILFQLGRMGIVVALPAIALSTVTGISVYTCILAMGALATLYTVLGGIEAVIWTDVVQVIVLMGGALLCLIIICLDVEGGFPNVVAAGYDAGKFHMLNWSWDYTATAVWVVVIGNIMGNMVPYTTDQTVIQRYLTTSDEDQAARAIWTNAFLTIPASLLFFGVGTALYVFYTAQPEMLSPNLAPDAILPWFVSRQLPVGIAGLVIAALFAAAMSSLDSSMNSIATAVVTDFFERLNPGNSDASRLRLARWLTLILGVVGTTTALAIASFEVASLLDLFLQIIGLFGGSLAGIFVLGIFTRRAHGTGAFIGAVASAVILFMVQRFTDVHFFLYAGIGIISCLVIGYACSLLIPTREKSIEGMTIYTLRGKTSSEEPTVQTV